MPPDLRADLEREFPDLDVPREIDRARAWCIRNRAKRKTPGGMPRFLRGWLERSQNSAGAPRPDPPTETLGAKPDARTVAQLDRDAWTIERTKQLVAEGLNRNAAYGQAYREWNAREIAPDLDPDLDLPEEHAR